MSLTKDFVVVEILEDSRTVISVVPMNWICQVQGKKTLLWPPQASVNELSLIKSFAEPDRSTWREYNVLKASKPIGIYADAVRMKELALRMKSLQKAEEELEKSAETGRRMHMPSSSRYGFESTSEESALEEDCTASASSPMQKESKKLLPPPPKFVLDTKVAKKRSLENDNERSLGKRKVIREITEDDCPEERPGQDKTTDARTAAEKGDSRKSKGAGHSSSKPTDCCRATKDMVRELGQEFNSFKEEMLKKMDEIKSSVEGSKSDIVPLKLNMQQALENQEMILTALKDKPYKSSALGNMSGTSSKD